MFGYTVHFYCHQLLLGGGWPFINFFFVKGLSIRYYIFTLFFGFFSYFCSTDSSIKRKKTKATKAQEQYLSEEAYSRDESGLALFLSRYLKFVIQIPKFCQLFFSWPKKNWQKRAHVFFEEKYCSCYIWNTLRPQKKKMKERICVTFQDTNLSIPKRFKIICVRVWDHTNTKEILVIFLKQVQIPLVSLHSKIN